MSNDEAYQKKYNIQPSPNKGAQASVLSRFGKQAQSLAGLSGKGPAVAPTAKAKADATANLSKLSLGLAKAQSNAQGRLTRIGSEMESDRIKAQREISQAKFDQSQDVPWYDDVADILTVTNNTAGLARAVGRASGDETDATINTEKYKLDYDFNIDRLMKVEGVVTPAELSDEALKEAHNIALSASRPGEGNIFNKAGRFIGDTVGGGIEGIPIIGTQMKRLRRDSVAEAEKTKLVQQNIMTKDMADKHYGKISEHLENMKNIYGKPMSLGSDWDRILFETYTSMMTILELGHVDYSKSQNFPIDTDTQNFPIDLNVAEDPVNVDSEVGIGTGE